MIDIGRMIRKLRDEREWSQGQLGRKMRVSKQTISNWENNRRAPDYETLEALADIFNVPMSYFVSSEDERKVLEKLNDTMQVIPYTPGRAMVPIVGVVRCGPGGLAYEDLQGAEVADVANPSEYFHLRAEGDSMEPDIRPGDLVLVHIQPEVESGELAVVIIDDEEGTLKKYIRKGNAIILQSFNQNYPPRVFVGDEMNLVKIAGKVVESKRKW